MLCNIYSRHALLDIAVQAGWQMPFIDSLTLRSGSAAGFEVCLFQLLMQVTDKAISPLLVRNVIRITQCRGTPSYASLTPLTVCSICLLHVQLNVTAGLLCTACLESHTIALSHVRNATWQPNFSRNATEIQAALPETP